MAQLLIEIGTEEIPAGYIDPALNAFRDHLMRHLHDNRIAYGMAQVYGTPRRLCVRIDDVADRQVPQTIELVGPPARVAFDENGRPTVAARKFAEKNNISPARLSIIETEKGRYAAASRTDRGQATRSILKASLPAIILSIPFPKTMRWADLSIHFARPIHSLLALLDKQVISFIVGDIKSGRHTFGHRFLHPKKIKLADTTGYLEQLEKAWVIADIKKRRTMMEQQMHEAVETVKGKVLPDAGLVDIVTHLIEYPATVLGSFEERFLELPREVLVTAMREHQRYFAVVDSDKRIMPYFLAVNNTLARDMNLVKKGHERVLKARLEDARFFFQTDGKTSLEEMTHKLKSVLFQAELGSVYDKVSRIRSVAGRLARRLALDETMEQVLDRAAFLSKADLVSLMVNEFPKLQGVMGRIYAQYAREPEPVARAIEEHYRPTASGGALPTTLPGGLLSLVDKMDSICGCFLIGLVPSGASDPYALRRQGIGLLQIILENNLPIPIPWLVQTSLAAFTGVSSAAPGDNKADDQASAFLRARLAHILESENISKDFVAAVLAVSEADPVPVIAAKARSLHRLKAEPEFDTLATGFKRVVNIIRKAEPADTMQAEVDPALFEYGTETGLHNDFMAIQGRVRDSLEGGEIDQAFNAVADLRKSVDQFFDDVLVMTDNAPLRRNRLALLKQISQLFALLADFSKISA